MLIGSEGTLGVITRVRWQLVPRLTARVAALVPFRSIAGAAELLAVRNYRRRKIKRPKPWKIWAFSLILGAVFNMALSDRNRCNLL